MTELAERQQVRDRRPILMPLLESEAIATLWRAMSPKSSIRWWRDELDTCVKARAVCQCRNRKAEVAVADNALEDCLDGARGHMVVRVLERLAATVECYCVPSPVPEVHPYATGGFVTDKPESLDDLIRGSLVRGKMLTPDGWVDAPDPDPNAERVTFWGPAEGPKRKIEIRNVLKVAGCNACPFNHDDTCMIDEKGRTRFDCSVVARPDWCPLLKGPVTVELE